jgi:hypothetical protein
MHRIFYLLLFLGFGWCIGFGCIIQFCIPNEMFVGASMHTAHFWAVTRVAQHRFHCTNVTNQKEFDLVLEPTCYVLFFAQVKSIHVPNIMYIPHKYFVFHHENEWIFTCTPIAVTLPNHKQDNIYKTNISYEDTYPYCPKRHIHGETISLVLEEGIQCEMKGTTSDVSDVVFFNGQEAYTKAFYTGIHLRSNIVFTNEGIALNQSKL